MVVAGWLRRYTYTEGKGFHLSWEGPGIERALMLRALFESVWAANFRACAVALHEIREGRVPRVERPPGPLDGDAVKFLRRCLEELGDEISGDRFEVLIHVVVGWGPKGSTRVIVEE